MTLGRVLAIGAVVAGAGVVATAATAPKPAGALPAYDCRGDELLMTRQNPDTGGVYLLNPKNTANPQPLITALPPDLLKLDQPINQIGITRGANQTMYFTYTPKNGPLTIIKYDVRGETWSPIPAGGPSGKGVGGVAGVVDLRSGKFYYGSTGGPSQIEGHAVINEYDPAKPVGEAVTLDRAIIKLPNGYGGNGDYAFDSNGNLYVVTADASNYWVYLVTADALAKLTPTNNRVDGTLVATSKGSPGGNNISGTVNGIAFGADGYIYTSSNASPAVLRQHNPSSGDIVKTSPLVNPSDLGSCADPNRITLYKNLPGGRYKTGDQFTLEISGGGSTTVNKKTTEGNEVGLQNQSDAEYVGPIPGVADGTSEYTVSETAAAGTDLNNYVSSWECVDKSQNGRLVASGTGTTGTFRLPLTGGVDVVCTFTNIPKSEIKLRKDVLKARINPTDQFKLSITPGGAPDATTTGNLNGVQAEMVTLAEALPGTQYTITESAAGTTNLSFYNATWECIDTGNQGVLIAKGTGYTGNLTVPTPGGPNRQLIQCTFANSAVLSTVEPSKSVNPPDGSTVNPGETLTYTLTFNNPGTTPANVDYVDDLSGVIDDADITAPPALASGAGLTVSAPAAGKFTVKGTVAPQTTATVTYQVKVKPDGARGDNDILNYLMASGVTTPPNCPVGNPLCTENFVPEPVVMKSVDPVDGSTVTAGQTLTYTLTFDNSRGKGAAPINWTDNLTDVLDDAVVTSQPSAANPSLTPSPVANGQFTITGTLPAGAKNTVTYKVQVKPDGQRGNNDLLNFVFPTGTKPPTTCPVGNPLCTENPVPQVVVSKSADPADGATVVPGQFVTYTLTFDNTLGKAAAPVNWDDDISGVLDDATLTAPPISSDPALVASVPSPRGIIKVTGTLPVGKKATVTYKVQVKPDGQRGDNVLLNFLFPTGTEPPSTCVVGNPLCTEHPVPEPVVSKSVDPLDGTTVTAGQTLTYTLTFSNARGKAPAEISWDDNMTKVLDDAKVTGGPTSSNPALTVSAVSKDNIVTIRGTLAPGQTVTVTMKVQVNPDGQRGDNDLLNFLMKPGSVLPSVCVVGDPLCTENPVASIPSIKLEKTVVLVTDTNNNGLNTVDDIVTYGFKVTNTGNVPLTNIVLTDPKLSPSPLTCPQTSLQPGASMNCTGPKYTLTKADLAIGRTVNVATVTGKPPVGPNVTSTSEAVVPVYPPNAIPPTGSNLPRKMMGIAGPMLLAGVALAMLGMRRRSGLSMYFR